MLANDPLSNIEIRPGDTIQVGVTPPAEAAPKTPGMSPEQAEADRGKSPRDAILPEDLAEDAQGVRGEGRIAPGDTVLVRLNIPDKAVPNRFALISMSEQVTPAGTANLSYFHEQFAVAKLTDGDLQKLIVDALQARGYNEKCLMFAMSRPAPEKGIEYSITGSRLSGRFKVSSHMRLLEAVMQAKGKNEPRARRITVIRSDPQHGNVDRRIEIPVDKLLAGEYSTNIVLRNNDRIVVEPSE